MFLQQHLVHPGEWLHIREMELLADFTFLNAATSWDWTHDRMRVFCLVGQHSTELTNPLGRVGLDSKASTTEAQAFLAQCLAVLFRYNLALYR